MYGKKLAVVTGQTDGSNVASGSSERQRDARNAAQLYRYSTPSETTATAPPAAADADSLIDALERDDKDDAAGGDAAEVEEDGGAGGNDDAESGFDLPEE